MKITKEGTLLWQPPADLKNNCNLQKYIDWLKTNRNVTFEHYDELWKWSVDNLEDFWESVWSYFQIGPDHAYLHVLSERKMPGAKWFTGAKLNYAEYLFRKKQPNKPALIAYSEIRSRETITWDELEQRVAAFAEALTALGVKKGDRVAAYLPNIPEAVIAFLAVASIGAIWSSCSPDFGSPTVVDRFKQIEPVVLLAVDGYRYGGKEFNRMASVREIQRALPTLKKTILLPYLSQSPKTDLLNDVILWDEFIRDHQQARLDFVDVHFDHPLWILFSSGTTGLPKAIVQGHGGILLEHLKQCVFHLDLKEEDRFFWFTTTGWMMWNLLVSGLLAGSAILLYDGNPGYPNLYALWEFAEKTEMTVFGTSAPYILSCMNGDISPMKKFRLEKLKCIGSTGAPLPPEGFAWVYDHVKKDLWLASVSGGTDVCSAFVTGSPLLPVYAGEIQCRALGAKVEAYDEQGRSLINEVGELVITEPLPSMPLYFWNDKNDERYKNSYFEMYPGIWRHGDWIKITDRGTCQIYGRSDSTINRGGIRMGTSEIYRVVEGVDGVVDSLVIDISDGHGNDFMPLFVVLKEGLTLSAELEQEIKAKVRTNCSPRHVPDKIYQIEEVPRTLNGKKMEVPVKKILMGVPVEKAVNKGSMSNPESLEFFIKFAGKKPF